MPRALRKAVSKNRVPNDIEPDLLFLASLLDPLVEKIKRIAPDLPEMAAKAREQIEPAAEKGYNVRPTPCRIVDHSAIQTPTCILLPSRGAAVLPENGAEA